VEDRQDSAINLGVQELVAMPTGSQRTGFLLGVSDAQPLSQRTHRFTISNHGQRDQVGMIIDRSERMTQRIPKLSTLVQRSRRLGRRVGSDTSREGKLLEESLEALDVFGDVGVYFRVRALEVAVGEDGGGAVTCRVQYDSCPECEELTWTRDEKGIQVILFDQSVKVKIGEDLSGITTPMTEQSTLQVFKLERFLEERVLLQVDHTETQVQACRHVSVVELEFILGEDLCILDGGSGGAKGRERCIGLLHGDDVWMCKRDGETTARECSGERGKAVLYTNIPIPRMTNPTRSQLASLSSSIS
jgi:hypothetical protein